MSSKRVLDSMYIIYEVGLFLYNLLHLRGFVFYVLPKISY